MKFPNKSSASHDDDAGDINFHQLFHYSNTLSPGDVALKRSNLLFCKLCEKYCLQQNNIKKVKNIFNKLKIFNASIKTSLKI